MLGEHIIFPCTVSQNQYSYHKGLFIVVSPLERYDAWWACLGSYIEACYECKVETWSNNAREVWRGCLQTFVWYCEFLKMPKLESTQLKFKQQWNIIEH